MSITSRLAKRAMLVRERTPPEPTVEDVGELSEVFQHPVFTQANLGDRQRILIESREAKYRSEMAYPWDAYFGMDLRPLLEGKRVLDLGCFTGGRTTAWGERYGVEHITGIDVNRVFMEGAYEFAQLYGVRAKFDVGTAEKLPYSHDTFDAILSFDVFEHVQDVGKALFQCWDTLKTDGRLFLVFPSYWHPVEHHLSLATTTPGLQYLFRPKTLIRAYNEILEQREGSEWYRRRNPDLEPWERGNTINGITAGKFARLVKTDVLKRDGMWTVDHRSLEPIGAIGRNASRNPKAEMVAKMMRPFTRVPLLREIALHRVTYILRKHPVVPWKEDR